MELNNNEVNDELKKLGLSVVTTDETTMLDVLGASVGKNGCSVVVESQVHR